MKFYPLKISDIRRETQECVSIAFDVPSELQGTFQFTQGQYLTLRTHLGNEEVRRSYSLCSSPLENEWRVAVKKVDGGVFSTFANETLKRGDTLEVAPPDGRFFPEGLQVDKPGEYVFFAAGSGITPVISIIKTILERSPESRITLVYGNKRAATVIFREQIEGLKNRHLGNFQVVHILSQERVDVPWQSGRINADRLNDLLEMLPEVLNADQFFICGPEDMIHTVRAGLEARNIPKQKIHLELFGTNQQRHQKQQQKTSGTVIATAEIKLDGVRFEVPIHEGQALLDAAMAVGADMPFACKGGVCCTCRAKLTEGKVEMEANYALDEDEVEAGFILTCQSHPLTPTLKVDFDQK
ncbi:MAG: phenylacetate-CoA oxygenase/reductase subunit PaaK [Saprospiraceae bacterium]|nr:phenylacetate-CoA oxygenase/reductase subunit PaaK [Saprospiraceae bacterium]